MFPSRFMPCNECGASVEQALAAEHECDDERRLDFEVFLLGDEIAAFDAELGAFLASRRGRFEVWYASRQRERRPPRD